MFLSRRPCISLFKMLALSATDVFACAAASCLPTPTLTLVFEKFIQNIYYKAPSSEVVYPPLPPPTISAASESPTPSRLRLSTCSESPPLPGAPWPPGLTISSWKFYETTFVNSSWEP